jgi:hypothetical protein
MAMREDAPIGAELAAEAFGIPVRGAQRIFARLDRLGYTRQAVLSGMPGKEP